MRDLDVVVVGAGPAGVATALTCRAHGLDVAVVERASFPRDKTCGDGLTAEALRRYRTLGFDPATLEGYAEVAETVVRSPSGRAVTLSLARAGAPAGVVRRRELDAAFVAHARSRGVDVHEATQVVDVRRGATNVTVTVAHGEDRETVRARYLVAADGHYSPVRRLLAPEAPAHLGAWHAYRQYAAHVDDPRLWVLFEPELLPGYAWVFPLPGGGANVGFGVRRDGQTDGKHLAALWRRVLDAPALRDVLGPDAELEGSARAWPIPTDYDPARLTAGRVLFVGDAARVVDPMTGEGIAQALTSGMLAAEAVGAGGGHRDVAQRYRRGVERALGRDLRFAERLGTVLRSPARTRAAVRIAGLTDWTRRNFARWLFEDYPRALVLTPDRWRRARRAP